MWKEVQRTRKKRSPVQSLCRVQSRQSLTTVRPGFLGSAERRKVKDHEMKTEKFGRSVTNE